MGTWPQELRQQAADEMGRHLVALGVLRKPEPGQKGARWEIYSGFLLREKDRLHWITAGHNLEELDALRKRAESDLILRWFDVDDRGSTGIPTSADALSLRYDDSGRVDIGSVPIDSHTQEVFERATHHRAFDGTNLGVQVPPQKHFLVGYPREVRDEVHVSRNGGGTLQFQAQAGCAKFHIQGRKPGLSGFWSRQDCIYGSISEVVLSSIVGMSGGPLIGITANGGGELHLALLGVQSVWLPDSRIARVEPISLALELVRR